jgi:hypothetical protein
VNLSIEAAFSAEGMVGHLAYVFLVASMVMRHMLWLRIFALASFALGVVYSLFILNDPVGSFWKCLLAAINLIQLALIHLENRRARFSAEDAAFAEACFSGVTKAVQRQILNLGTWENLAAGTVLAEEGKPLHFLTYVAGSAVLVTLQGRQIAHRGPGALIGELTVATAAPATSTVTTQAEARVWRVEAEAVRRAIQTRPQQAAAFQSAFFRAASAKLMESQNAADQPSAV